MARASVPSRRMTIDDTPARAHPSSAHEIERYGGLFARRTRGMTSSAMRDMMAVTARPEVISLATGLPDTTTFPAEDFAALMSRVAVDSSAAALQYGPDRRPRGRPPLHRGGDGRRGHGGRDRRPDDHHRRPAGDRPRVPRVPRSRRRRGRRGADLSRRRAVLHLLPGRRRADRDGRRRHADRRARGDARAAARGRPAPEVHLHDPELPQPGRGHDVARAPQGAGADRERAGARRARGQPVRAAALRRRAAADAVFARRRALRDLRRHVLEDPLGGPAARLGRGPRADPRAPEPGQAGRRPLLVAAEPVLRRRVLRAPRLAHVPERAARDLPAPARRDAGRDGRVPAARDDLDARRRAASSSGRGCRTTSTPPTCWRGRCASTSRSCPAAPRISTGAVARRCG